MTGANHQRIVEALCGEFGRATLPDGDIAFAISAEVAAGGQVDQDNPKFILVAPDTGRRRIRDFGVGLGVLRSTLRNVIAVLGWINRCSSNPAAAEDAVARHQTPADAWRTMSKAFDTARGEVAGFAVEDGGGASGGRMKNAIGLYDSMVDPNLFGKVFAGPSYWTWRVVAKLIDGIPLTEPREIELFERCTGRKYDRHGRRAVRRLFMNAGRRAGKDRFESAVAIWRAALCCNWRKHISPGEGAVVLLLGADNRQGGILSKYCRGLLEMPMLAAEVVRDIKGIVEFKNGASLEIATNDARLVRGRSAIAVLGTEVSFWKTAEFAASSDEEVISSAEPSMSMCPDGGIMIMGSSVYRKRGLMYRKYKELFGNDDADELFWFAPSLTMNPKIPLHVIEAALASNPEKARAEYQNIWRDDVTDCFPEDATNAATDVGTYERAPLSNVTYFAHADAAGGTGKDSFAFSISHRDSSYVIDVVREYKPRFIPAAVIAELAQLCKAYRITTVRGDKYAIGFHAAEWKTHGITFEPCENSTSENYLTILPLMLAGCVRLVDNKTLRTQLTSLERKPGDSAREQVSHPQHDAAHDDVSCACAGAIVAAMPTADSGWPLELWMRVNDSTAELSAQRAYEMQRFADGVERTSIGNGGYTVGRHWGGADDDAAAKAWDAFRNSYGKTS